MYLGYYKFKIKEAILQFVILLNLRKKGVSISSGSIIARKSEIASNVFIGESCRIGNNVVLKENVHVGSFASLSNIYVGEHSVIESGVKCTGFGKGKIVIGKESYIGINNILDWSDDITIGDYVHIAGPSTGLWTHSSVKQCLAGLPLTDKNIKYRPTSPIVIDSNVYIGGNCTIYPGVAIGHHSIVTPNSAVTKNVEPNTMVGGVPAKVIKRL